MRKEQKEWIDRVNSELGVDQEEGRVTIVLIKTENIHTSEKVFIHGGYPGPFTSAKIDNQTISIAIPGTAKRWTAPFGSYEDVKAFVKEFKRRAEAARN